MQILLLLPLDAFYILKTILLDYLCLRLYTTKSQKSSGRTFLIQLKVSLEPFKKLAGSKDGVIRGF